MKLPATSGGSRHNRLYTPPQPWHNCIKGISIIEILIVVGILVIVLASSFSLSSSTDIVSQSKDARDQIKSALYTAQVRSRAGVNQSSHGVNFASHAVTVFQGSSYAGRDTVYDQTTTFADAITITTDVSEVVFVYGSGVPYTTSTIVIDHAVTGRQDLFINEYGVVE